MAFDIGISSAIAQYVYTQTAGTVTEPVNGSYIQAYCEYLGITEPLNASWLQALCNHFGITEPLNGSWTIALANYYGITYPAGGTWWYALSQAPAGYLPTADFTSDVTSIAATGTVNFTDLSTVDPLGPPITAWSWLFEGGTPATSTLQNPSVQYNTVGTYDVSLEVTNADGSNTKLVPDYMTVVAAPIDYTISEFGTDIMYVTSSKDVTQTTFATSLMAIKSINS